MADPFSCDTDGGARLTEFYRAFHQPDVIAEKSASIYDEWANEWDPLLKEVGYNCPQKCAKALLHYLHGRKDVKILDVGAGTGMVAKTLQQGGLKNIDALDNSEGMLKVAKDQGLYENYIIEEFTEKNDYLQSNSYDALTGSGIMEHIFYSVMKEMVRVVKKGGFIVLVSREKFWISANVKYQWHLEMAKLELEGQIRLLERTSFPNYITGVNGNVYVFEVLVD